jgi:hypothetical protein
MGYLHIRRLANDASSIKTVFAEKGISLSSGSLPFCMTTPPSCHDRNLMVDNSSPLLAFDS